MIKVAVPKALDQAAVLLSEEVQAGVEAGTLMVQKAAQEHAVVFTGTLRRSLTSAVTTQDGQPRGLVGTKLLYARPVEFGSKPHTPPIAALQPWAKRHNIPVGALWMKIRKFGTKAHPFLRPALTEQQQAVIDRLRQALQAAVQRIAEGGE